MRKLKQLYRRWLAFSERLGGVTMGILFGACYLVLMAPFGLFFKIWDPLRIRRKALDAPSHWTPRRSEPLTRANLERMG